MDHVQATKTKMYHVQTPKSVSEKSALGSTGYQPVPSDDSPDGTGTTLRGNLDALFDALRCALPVGESPTGAGESPALPIFKTRSKINVVAGRGGFVAAAILAAVEGVRLAARNRCGEACYLGSYLRRSAGRDAPALRQAGRPPLLWLRRCRATLYRRLPVGRPFDGRSACGLEIRDTAGWKSALLRLWLPPRCDLFNLHS